MRPQTIALMITAGCGGGAGGTNDKDGDSDRPPLNCGMNAFDGGGTACECVGSYTPCADDDISCCAYDAASFDLTVIDIGVMPYKPDGGGWDWDGDVPDWMIEAANVIGYFSVEAATMAEVLEYTDEVAPYFLEGTVPPDPFYEVWEGDNQVVDASWTVDDDFEASWGMQTWVRPTNQQDIYLWFHDEDLLFDDDIMVITVPRDTFDTFAGWGPVEFRDLGSLFSLTVEIEPNF